MMSKTEILMEDLRYICKQKGCELHYKTLNKDDKNIRIRHGNLYTNIDLFYKEKEIELNVNLVSIISDLFHNRDRSKIKNLEKLNIEARLLI